MTNIRRWWRPVDSFVVLVIALSALPIVVAVVRAIADGWVPQARRTSTGPGGSAERRCCDSALPIRLFGGAGVAVGVGGSNGLATSIQSGFRAAEPRVLAVLHRFAALRQSVQTSTVAVLLTPADEVGAEPGA